MLHAIRNRSIALLWSGQALSAIGDEIYRVALIWLAVTLIGADTGYLAAGQYAALLALSLVGGKWADHWDHTKTMIWVDSLRGLIVLVPVILVHFTPLSMSVLWGMALSLAALSAFFDPALQASLPRVSPDARTLQAATGLMSTTLRLARVVGPAIIGLLTPFVETIQFFALDAVSFGASAISIGLVRQRQPRHWEKEAALPRLGFRESIVAGFHAIRHSPEMRYVLLGKGLGAGVWNLAYALGLALYAHEIAPHDVRAFGWMISSYGVGNLFSALVLGNMERRNPARILFFGHIWMGLGFILIPLAPNLPCVMLATAFTAMGGPANDLPFIDLAQESFPVAELPRVIRLRMILETASTLVFMLFAPMLFRFLGTKLVIALSGIVTFSIGAYGLLLKGETNASLA